MTGGQDDREQLTAVRGRVLAVVGHALRTPVTTVRGLVEVLERSGPDAMHRVLPALTRTTRVMERLVDDLLIASDVVTALPVRAAEPVTLAATVRTVWGDLDEAEEGGLEVRGEAVALVGHDGLRWMLRHLLDNARKYGEGPVEVEIEQLEGGSGGSPRACLRIATGGEELSEEQLQVFLEPFYREETAVMAAHGLGLGLPVTHRLAVHAGGTLELEPRPDGGLVAVLVLPAP